jgi:hypothetical protein
VGALVFNYAVVFSAYYLVNSRWKWAVTPGSWSRATLISVASTAAIFMWMFARPRVEIAGIGQSRLWRTTKVAGSIGAALIVAALAKWLFHA